MKVDGHNNGEGVIRCYMSVMPPRGVESILDIGCGLTTPWRGIMTNRCKRYVSTDIRDGERIDVCCDITEEGFPFKDNEFEWGWAVECLEHIPHKLQYKFLDEIFRVCRNVVICFPTPSHPTFHGDPGHKTVIVDWRKYTSQYKAVDMTTKTGRRR